MNIWTLSVVSIFLSWSSSFSWSARVGLLAAFLVFLGVIGEEIADAKCLEKEARARLKRSVKRWSVTILLLGLFGDLAAVVIGQREMAALTKEAGDAATSARNAAQDAIQAKSDAGDAKKKADAAGLKADAVSKKVVLLNTRMDATASRLTALRSRLEWRALSRSQYATFQKELAQFSGSKVLVFVFHNEDIEAKTYAVELARFFHDGAHWNVFFNATNETSDLPVGTDCTVDTNTAAGRALAKVMAQLPCSTIRQETTPGFIGVIRVGQKPPP